MAVRAASYSDVTPAVRPIFTDHFIPCRRQVAGSMISAFAVLRPPFSAAALTSWHCHRVKMTFIRSSPVGQSAASRIRASGPSGKDGGRFAFNASISFIKHSIYLHWQVFRCYLASVCNEIGIKQHLRPKEFPSSPRTVPGWPDSVPRIFKVAGQAVVDHCDLAGKARPGSGVRIDVHNRAARTYCSRCLNGCPGSGLTHALAPFQLRHIALEGISSQAQRHSVMLQKFCRRCLQTRSRRPCRENQAPLLRCQAGWSAVPARCTNP